VSGVVGSGRAGVVSSNPHGMRQCPGVGGGLLNSDDSGTEELLELLRLTRMRGIAARGDGATHLSLSTDSKDGRLVNVFS
jgi:hypothetical protein